MQPPVADLRRRRLRVAPVAEEDDRVALDAHRDLALDQPELVPRVGASHPAWPLRPGGAVPDQQVRLRLAVELVQAHPEPLPAPRGGLLADCLAAARQRAQRHHRPVRPTHQPQRRRGHEHVADADPRDQVERLLGVEARRPERDHGRSVGEAGHEDVVEAADPGPVGRGPVPVAFLRVEVVRELESGQVPGEDTVAVERALGRPRRAGRVDEERRASAASSRPARTRAITTDLVRVGGATFIETVAPC